MRSGGESWGQCPISEETREQQHLSSLVTSFSRCSRRLNLAHGAAAASRQAVVSRTSNLGSAASTRLVSR